MYCLYCNHLIPTFSYIEKYMKMYYCSDCNVQFSGHFCPFELKHIAFFPIFLRDKLYSVELWLYTETIVRNLPNKDVILQLPYMKNITPTNVKNKLETWLYFQ